MKLSEALRIVNGPAPVAGPPLTAALACGFTPLHLCTFLEAQLRLRNPDRRVSIDAGLYGDAAGNVERLRDRPGGPAALVLEWPDFDPRLGLRDGEGVFPDDLPDVAARVAASAARVGRAVATASARRVVAVALPTLPLVRLSPLPGWLSGPFETRLEGELASLAERLAGLPTVRLIGRASLDAASPVAGRRDVRAELAHGFPYSLPHASALARMIAQAVAPSTPKKGLITDLDGTLWKGVLGDDGPDGVSWDPENQSRAHALYQQALASLARSGVLIGVASKNDRAAVDAAFRRPDLVLRPGMVYPVEAHWGPKSQSVARILAAWNVGAGDVVFVDDSPMELAEVRRAFPEMECLAYPGDDAGVFAFVEGLRDTFGRMRVSDEDRVRLSSLRQSRPVAGVDHDGLLRDANAEITFDFDARPPDPRALELVNKTNQFNLNGRRFGESDWLALNDTPGRFLGLVSYADRFGRLGKVSVLGGRVVGETLYVDVWVLSCRAFSRRIEHQCLRHLFDRFGASTLVFDLVETPQNGPLREFFAGMKTGPVVHRRAFEDCCPPLHHAVREPVHDS